MLMSENRPRALGVLRTARGAHPFSPSEAPPMIRAILAASAGVQVLLWFTTWRFLRRAQRGGANEVIASTAVPRLGLALSFLGYAGWFLGSLGYAANPTWPLFQALSRNLFFPRVGSGLLVGGHGLVIWATLSLGSSFDLRPRLIVGHRLIRHGPYRSVRHPLYTGLQALYVGTFLLVPCALFLLSAIAAMIGNALRAQAEERVLLARYGEAYRAYARSVGRFLPKVDLCSRRRGRPPHE